MLPVSAVAVFALCITATLVCGRSTLRRAVAAACITVASVIAFDRALSPFVRELLTFTCIVATLKCVQIASSLSYPWTPAQRIWTALVFFDVREAKPAPSLWAQAGDKLMLAKILVMPVTVAVVIALPFLFAGRLSTAGAWALKLACGAVFAYVALDLGVQGMRLAHRVAGLDIGELHRDPILSRSLGEFWGERWNLPVTRWLHEFCFRPCARWGAVSGLVAAFALSALLHFWLFFAAVNLISGLMATAFFLLQVPALLLERRWRIRRWPTAVARAWTIAFLLLTSPLLTIPMIWGLEMQLQHS